MTEKKLHPRNSHTSHQLTSRNVGYLDRIRRDPPVRPHLALHTELANRQALVRTNQGYYDTPLGFRDVYLDSSPERLTWRHRVVGEGDIA